MLLFHERLARIGLEALESYGCVLAGGYAISTNGIGDRPSADALWSRGETRDYIDIDEIDPAVVG